MTLHGMTFETSRGMGIYIECGNGNLIAGCTFRNLGSFAVFLGQGIKEDPDGLTGYKLQNGADRGEIVTFEPASRTLGSYGMALYADPTWTGRREPTTAWSAVTSITPGPPASFWGEVIARL